MGWREFSLVLLVGAIGLMVWAYPLLPDPMATQFTFGGEPARWSSRAGFAALFLGTGGLINVLFLGGIPWLLRATGAARFNVPNRDYWLSSPERREEALQRMAPFLARSAVFVNLLLLLTLHLVAQWNGVPVSVIVPAAATGPLLLTTVGGGVLVLMLWAFHDFRIPERDWATLRVRGSTPRRTP